MIYIDSSGNVFPCCWVPHDLNNNITMKYFIAEKAWEKDFIKILQNDWFSEILPMSFESFPLGEPISLEPLVQPIIDWSSSIFTGGLLIALPIMIAMLLVNTGLGIITRSAPSLNIIAVGFPAITLVGIFILLLSLRGILQLIEEFWSNAFEQLSLIMAV